MTGYVYFIQAAESRRIKIGYSVNPWKRLSVLQTSSPEVLELVALIPGSESDEKRLHRKHEQYHLRGEWFIDGIGLIRDIARLTGADRVTEDQRLSALKVQELVALGPSSSASSLGRIGAHVSWANTEDRTARTAPARRGLEQRFLDEAGGDPVRAAHLRKAYYQRLALKSAQVRRARKEAR